MIVKYGLKEARKVRKLTLRFGSRFVVRREREREYGVVEGYCEYESEDKGERKEIAMYGWYR